jgi:hypothetical protein
MLTTERAGEAPIEEARLSSGCGRRHRKPAARRDDSGPGHLQAHADPCRRPGSASEAPIREARPSSDGGRRRGKSMLAMRTAARGTCRHVQNPADDPDVQVKRPVRKRGSRVVADDIGERPMRRGEDGGPRHVQALAEPCRRPGSAPGPAALATGAGPSQPGELAARSAAVRASGVRARGRRIVGGRRFSGGKRVPSGAPAAASPAPEPTQAVRTSPSGPFATLVDRAGTTGGFWHRLSSACPGESLPSGLTRGWTRFGDQDMRQQGIYSASRASAAHQAIQYGWEAL